VIALPAICSGTPAFAWRLHANVGTRGVAGDTTPVLTGTGTPGVAAVEAVAVEEPASFWYPLGGETNTTAF
jgi:hypothetical protein